jgi:hypothetical protein
MYIYAHRNVTLVHVIPEYTQTRSRTHNTRGVWPTVYIMYGIYICIQHMKTCPQT